MPRTKKAFEVMRENTREKIETASLPLFARKGLSVTVDEIAQAAGVSKGLLYSHYSSKEALINEFAARATEISSNNIKEIMLETGSASEKIKKITFLMCQMFTEQPIAVEYFMFMVQVGMSGYEIPESARYTEKIPNPIQILAQIISHGQAEGTVVSGDSLQLSTIYWAAFQGLCCYSITGMPLSLEPQMLWRILLNEIQ